MMLALSVKWKKLLCDRAKKAIIGTASDCKIQQEDDICKIIPNYQLT